ncbi:coproporphyrinogen oxidase [Chitinasiproducens palmae]|uniref:coproporphyrinogen oxidase n=1 Tax=Chitinasiproducens palmae TaxID=1770053 RepID=A0A1H2PQZ0_9BURK|nr:coproporphyrinogen oxidase [Chitinasiproducens palmae]
MSRDALDLSAVETYLTDLQRRIVDALGAFDGKPFLRDAWRKPEGAVNGAGLSCVIEEGGFFERGGCNFSHVRGDAMPLAGTAGRANLAGRPFDALGVSMVLHPRNPYCPTTHMNVRLFVAWPQPGTDDAPVFWFGGGMDLTPYYGFEEDARHFHQVCHDALAPFGDTLYPAFKLWCDEYFFLPHRNEARGVGGVFFDDFSELGFEGSFAMLRAVGDAFLAAYMPVIERRRDTPYGERERDFQSYRRGRYAEFNLVIDRGTAFGLRSGGRTESILMSLPPTCTWRYDWAPEPGTPEAALLTDFLPPRDWLPAQAGQRQASRAAGYRLAEAV